MSEHSYHHSQILNAMLLQFCTKTGPCIIKIRNFQVLFASVLQVRKHLKHGELHMFIPTSDTNKRMYLYTYMWRLS
jgi:hypothetical protein